MTPHPTPDVATAHEATTASTASRWSYGAVWRALPRGLGYLAPTIVIAIVVSAVLNSLFSTSVGLILIVVGVPLLLLTLLLARFAGTFEVIRLRASGQPAIDQPHWRLEGETSAWRRILHPIANGHYWLSLLHGAIVAPIIATLSFVLTVVWVSFALAGTLAPFAWMLGLTNIGSSNRDYAVFSEAAEVGIVIATFLVGVFTLLTLPYLVKALVWLHATVARPFLGRFKSEQLEQQVSSLFSSRQSAVAAEGTALRRIERDIHDGPQQRLIRLQMDLAAAERRIAENPAEASTLVADARRQAQDALDELRHLSRGFAPPLLLDRGLFAALESLASRSSIPVALETQLGATANLPDEVARNAYFVASELIANAAKHSQASGITLSVVAADGALAITVRDDGIGGAVERTGHGLEGLRDRAAGLGGELSIESPEGGPTIVRATLPLAGVSGVSAPAADHDADREPRA